jgi:general secretion pathway protein A
MYLDFFNLLSAPFSIAPDPSFLYLTEKHQEALAHLQYSTAQKGGFILLTGEIGTGKTTLCRHFLKTVPEQYQTAFIFNPRISAVELLATICDEFGIKRPDGTASVKQLTDLINIRLLDIHAAGQNALLVVDEAQNLSMEVLEQVRLLTNLETTEHKLLQIILIGQPQLKTMLGREELRQLSQRIVARYHLEPLSAQETARYIRHRLVTSGCSREAAEAIFPSSALRKIYRSTQGVPRLVNVLCDRALLGAYVENRRIVSRRIVRNAMREAFGDDRPARRPLFPGWRPVAVASGLAIIAGCFLWYFQPPYSINFPDIAVGKKTKAVAARPTPETVTPVSTRAPLYFPSAGKESEAFRSLLKLWRVPAEATEGMSDEKDACLVAFKYGLRCLSGTNRNWQQFRKFNLPAVLALRDIDQHDFHAVIESTTEDQASLLINGQPVTLSLRQLAFYWTGRFTLLWQPPPGYQTEAQLTQKSLNELMKAPSPWLLRMLGAGESNKLPLHQLIENFQRKAGIQIDGIIGMQTLIMLSRSAENTPVLQPDQ